jgi:WD40 repeat protein
MAAGDHDFGHSLLASIMGADEHDRNSSLLDPNLHNNGGVGIGIGGSQEDKQIDADPFNIDHYKLLHEPGVTQCRGRNILNILSDRSMRGPGYYHHRCPPPHHCLEDFQRGDDDEQQIDNDNNNIGNASREELSTPVNVPTKDDDDSQISAMMVDDNNQFGSTSYHSPTPGMADNDHNNVTTPVLPVKQDDSTSNDDGNTNNSDSSSILDNNTPTNITSELTSYVEYASATKFRGSYLQHLRGDAPVRPIPPPTTTAAHIHRNPLLEVVGRGGMDNSNTVANINNNGSTNMTREQLETQRQLQQHLRQHNNGANRNQAGGGGVRQALPNNANNNNNNNNNEGVPNANNFPPRRFPAANAGAAQRARARPGIIWGKNAVSTISIDFSPNGRTLASSHGDHTVKITCAHTGKLLRELEGHPRTPWTVKYHPTNYRIVASGCLGCQVRVWDWNFQTEKVRRERRESMERRFGGRYHFGSGNEGNSSGSREPLWNVSRGGFTSSPRGVVDQYWKGGAAAGDGGGHDDEQMTDCLNTSSSNASASGGNGSWESQYRQHGRSAAALTKSSVDGVVEDDYGAYTLAAMGVPVDDPAWYDTESEVYNCENGLGVCLHMIRLNHAIISLSFHPSGEILAIASGSTLHLWDYDEEKRKKRDALLQQQRQAKSDTSSNNNNTSQLSHSLATIKVRETDDSILNRHQNQNYPHGRTMDFAHDSALRCVHFPPGGDTIIIGGVNPQSYNEGLPNNRRERGGMQGGGMSFHLRLWDFNLDAVLDPCTQNRPAAAASARGNSALGGRISDEGDLSWNFVVTKETLANPRILIPRVLLYNDGGFDLSRDGMVLSACAEYWLPEGVNSAMELIQSLQEIEEKANSPADTKSSPANDSSRSPVYLSPTRPKVSAFPDPRTPPPNLAYAPPLEPPSPPGKRNLPHIKRGASVHNPHPLSIVASSHPLFQGGGGRYVPHIVTISLDSSPPPDGELLQLDPKVLRTESMRKYPKLGQLLMAAPLDGAKASGVTCVKLSPSAEYCLLGYGVRENIPSVDGLDENRHPVTSLYNVKKGMKHISTLTSVDDDVNIARFHPESGHGFVYGTKQGRVRVLAKRVWNHYHVDDDSRC